MINFTVPETHTEAVLEAMAAAGGGKLDRYSHCSFSQKGIGRFKPLKGSNTAIGTQGVIEEVVEDRIEVVCRRDLLKGVLEAGKKAHPYEETVFCILPLYEEGWKRP
jgi:hypothetical protein